MNNAWVERVVNEPEGGSLPFFFVWGGGPLALLCLALAPARPQKTKRTDDQEGLAHAVRGHKGIELGELAEGEEAHAVDHGDVEPGPVLPREPCGVDPDAAGEGGLAGQHQHVAPQVDAVVGGDDLVVPEEAADELCGGGFGGRVGGGGVKSGR